MRYQFTARPLTLSSNTEVLHNCIALCIAFMVVLSRSIWTFVLFERISQNWCMLGLVLLKTIYYILCYIMTVDIR